MTTTPRAPVGLGTRGKRLWKDVTALIEPDPAQLTILEEACRTSDRLDRLDAILRGVDAEWLTVRLGDGGDVTVVLAGPLAEARQQQTVLKQLLVTLRLPDAQTGVKPQFRGARGAYAPKGSTSGTNSGNVTAIDRAARAARGA